MQFCNCHLWRLIEYIPYFLKLQLNYMTERYFLLFWMINLPSKRQNKGIRSSGTRCRIVVEAQLFCYYEHHSSWHEIAAAVFSAVAVRLLEEMLRECFEVIVESTFGQVTVSETSPRFSFPKCYLEPKKFPLKCWF